ncbi:MAG: outer membrane beta-barrel protein, partial [Bacteroidota bacterium]
MKIQFTFFLAVIALIPLAGQGFSGGFKAGLNFNTFDGPLEDNGAGTEVFNSTTGFHIGATFAYGFTDLFGLKADLMYSQKGVEQR